MPIDKQQLRIRPQDRHGFPDPGRWWVVDRYDGRGNYIDALRGDHGWPMIYGSKREAQKAANRYATARLKRLKCYHRKHE